MNTKNFKEKCWIIYGYKILGITVYESHGSFSSVTFNWEKVFKKRKSILGFNHTHPPNSTPHPSSIDNETMIGWVKTLGKPLICGIKSDKQQLFLYKRNIDNKVIYISIPFIKLFNFLIILGH